MTKLSKYSTLLGLTTTAMVCTASVAFSAATCPAGFPDKPISFIVGFGAGGGTDAIGRAVAGAIEQQQGWTMVVENKPGASGGVMAAGLKISDPDGYTIGMAGTDTVAVGPYQNPDATYTYEDFDYLGSAMQINFGLVALADAPFSTLEELVEFAKENGRATISTSGVSQTVAVGIIAEHFGVNLISVPGKGAADALKTALGGHVDATTQGSQHVQQIKAGDMKQLASLIADRVSYAPDSMTLQESGIDLSLEAHTTFYVPKGIDAAIKTCLEGAIDEAVHSDSYGELMDKFSNQALNLGPAGIREVIVKMAGIYKEALAK